MGIISKRIKLVGPLDEYETIGMFDSGASYSFIQHDVAERLEIFRLLPQPMTFEMAKR